MAQQFARRVTAQLFGVLIVSAMCVVPAGAQLSIRGEGAISIAKTTTSNSQYSFNSGHPSFIWRGNLLADAPLADNISFYGTGQVEQNQEIEIQQFEIRLSDILSSGITLDAGQIELPFGNLGERRFPSKNPFFHLPIANDHVTTLGAQDYNLWALHPELALSQPGVRILDEELYDIGIMASGTLGIFDCSVALINGMISATSTYAPEGMNPKNGFGLLARVAATPLPELTLVASVAQGPFVREQAAGANSALAGEDPADYPQTIMAGDIAFQCGHLTIDGQVLYNTWKFDDIPNLETFAYTIEGRYALSPRWYIAARAGGMRFNEITADIPDVPPAEAHYRGRWDDNVGRLEGAVGYRVSREVLLKTVYEYDRTSGLEPDMYTSLVALQTVFSF